jgi:fido (protein-threonine AMPylation protein)
MLFPVSEVHPFVDGNGRVARTVMNAELTAAGQHRLVVPVVWRNEYLTAMRQMSRANDVRLYARTLGFAWRWTAMLCPQRCAQLTSNQPGSLPGKEF